MDLIRKHLMIEGTIEKECLVRILEEVTAIYRKSNPLPLITTALSLSTTISTSTTTLRTPKLTPRKAEQTHTFTCLV